MGRWKNHFWMGVLFATVSSAIGADIGNLKIKAEAGDAAAQEAIARYYYGNRQYTDAYNWYLKAAKAGRAESQYSLGLIQIKGKPVLRTGESPVPANPERAIHWFKTSAGQDHAGAQAQLGICYAEGVGVKRDPVEAYKWSLLAAEKSVAYGAQANQLALKLSPDQIRRGKQLAREYLASLEQRQPKSVASYVVSPQADLNVPSTLSNRPSALTIPNVANKWTKMAATKPQNQVPSGATTGGTTSVFNTILGSVATAGRLTMGIILVGLLLFGFFLILLIHVTRSKPKAPKFPSPRKPAVCEQTTKSDTTKDAFRHMDWFQFEKLTELIYTREGYRVERRGGANPDGGIDMVLTRGTERIAVQCKHWKSQQAGVKVIREFLGAITAERFDSGIFVITNHVTEEAQQLALKNNIQIIESPHIETMLKRHNAAYDPEFKAILEGTEKYCPKCDSKMVRRVSQRGSNIGEAFWGCSTFPKCRFILSA